VGIAPPLHSQDIGTSRWQLTIESYTNFACSWKGAHARSDRQRTQVINALRAHLAEFGIVAAQGNKGVKELLAIVADQQDARLPVDARASVIVLAAQLEAGADVDRIDREADQAAQSRERSESSG
jgi:transposase